MGLPPEITAEEVAEERERSRNNRPQGLNAHTDSTWPTRPWKGRSSTMVHAFLVSPQPLKCSTVLGPGWAAWTITEIALKKHSTVSELRFGSGGFCAKGGAGRPEAGVQKRTVIYTSGRQRVWARRLVLRVFHCWWATWQGRGRPDFWQVNCELFYSLLKNSVQPPQGLKPSQKRKTLSQRLKPCATQRLFQQTL